MKKLSLIVPVHNEKNTLEKLLGKIIDVELPSIEKEIIIVDDNSTDGSREIAMDFYNRHPQCKLFLVDDSKGKGQAVRIGLEKASGDILAIQDADLEYNPNDYKKLILPFIRDNAQFVLGSRHLQNNGTTTYMIRSFPGKEKILSSFLNLGGYIFHALFNVLYATKLSDPATMYKLFTRDLYKKVHLTSNYFDLDLEIVAKFIRLGIHPIEIPVEYHPRSFAEGKKVKISRDIPRWIYTMIKYRLMPKTKF